MITLPIDKLLKKYENDMLAIAKEVCTQSSIRAISTTPRDTGAAQESYTPSLNAIRTKNSEGFGTIQNYPAVIKKMKIGDYYSLANGKIYIYWLENMSMMRGGQLIINRQQPGHMLKRLQAEFQQVTDLAVKRVVSGS